MGEQSAAQEGGPWTRMAGAKSWLGGLQTPKDGGSVSRRKEVGRGWGLGTPGRSSLAEVEAEDGAGEGALLQHALQGRGGPAHGQGWVGHAHDAVKLRIDEVGARLILTQAELLVGDLDTLDLEGTQSMQGDKCNSTYSLPDIPRDP